MSRISASQARQLGEALFRDRLRLSLARNDVDFAAMAPQAQREFVAAAHEGARAAGLRTEQGVAGYVLGALWLGVGFEEGSRRLQSLLRARLPEARKVHAMGEWVHDQLGRDATPQSGDAALRRSFVLTAPWGTSGS